MPIVDTRLDDDPPWFLMPLAEEDYTAQIARDRASGQVEMQPLLDILAGLEELHRLGYVHRDLKPHNALLLHGSWVISDLGLVLPAIRTTTTLTSTDSAWGTQGYAAPELVSNFRGAPTQADIYSMGCILHDIVGTAARVPFAMATAPGPLGRIIERATMPEPQRRFSDVAALRSALVVAIVAPQPTVATPRAAGVVESLLDEDNPIPLQVWEEALTIVESDPASPDANGIFRATEAPQIAQLAEIAPQLFARFVPMYCEWVREGPFVFAYCDVLASSLRKIFDVGSIRERAEAALAAFVLGCSHNRWHVMRTFLDMAGPAAPQDVADRLAIDIAAMGREALNGIRQIEDQIRIGRSHLHPTIQATFEQLEAQYSS
jgi:hypothetical protein